MACCKCCCGGEDCASGQEGKCCCGGSGGVCCQPGEYCCSGVCEPSPCPEGTCCDAYGDCLNGGPGGLCEPLGSPFDDGCYCDSACYSVCFDCCGADAATCCTPAPELTSLWDEYSAPGKVRLRIASLEEGMAAYGVDMDEAWGAAMQCGACIKGDFHMLNFGRLSLVLCLQDLAAGRTPWLAVQDHQSRVRGTAGAMRAA